ncbi:MAG: TolC family protein [Planctomycetales bacterium]
MVHKRLAGTPFAARFRAVLTALVATACAAGCTRPYVATRVDYIANNAVTGTYDQSTDEEAAQVARTPPPTVDHPEQGTEWRLTLEESLQLALENNRQIRVVGYLPAEAGTAVESQLSAFDPVFEVGSAWRKLHGPATIGFPESVTDQYFNGPAGYGLNATNGISTLNGFSQIPGSNTVGLFKRNATGGLTRLSTSADYTSQTPGSNTGLSFNPQWNTRLTLGLEQPLLQGAGVEFNRAPILIARSAQKQADQNFDVNIRVLLRDVERSYWEFYYAYNDLKSREVGMKLALALWQAEKAKLEEGSGARPDVAQVREQYESFRDFRLRALNQVLEVEAAFRLLLGLPPQDDRQIIPADQPTLAEFLPNWDVSHVEALQLRPELAAQRLAIRQAELELRRQKNGLMPDLTAIASYSRTGVGEQLGTATSSSFHDNLDDWTVGIRLRTALGKRAAHAATRRAELSLMRERAALRNLEQTVYYELQRAYRSINTQYESLQIRQSRRHAAEEFLESQIEFFNLGKTNVFVVLNAQSRYADALRDEALAVTQYNQALIDWEFARGTILYTDNVLVASEETLPANVELYRHRVRRAERSLPFSVPEGNRLHQDEFSCTDPAADRMQPYYDPSVYLRYGASDPGEGGEPPGAPEQSSESIGN